MTTLYRCITEDDTSQFCHRVSEALSKGWSLHGGASMAFDPVKGVMRLAQPVTKEVDVAYSPELKLGQQ